MTIPAQYRPADAKPGPMKPIVPYVAMADNLDVPRRIAAAVVAADGSKPRLVVDVGSFLGELLEAFLDQFPDARGQWTDATDNSRGLAGERLARFGDRVDYRVGCPGRNAADGTVPSGVDVLATSWVSSHRGVEGTAEFYRGAAGLLAPGGWLVVMDHIGYNDPERERRMLAARHGFQVDFEGPPPHHDGHIATREQHLAGFAAAGITDVDVVWESLGTVLFMGRRAGTIEAGTVQ
ncbi:hypothetical protein SBRCBS47491_005354 [Sporothrix bragantina]|uniref:Class I SAM-dependent methyltransferase n=1 Tax=Sporothrix bragantina TaxID=671064 RepID=A0ABP0BXU7_9PEZI